MYGDNEDLLGAYFTSRPEARDKVFLASKFAIQMDENGGMVGVDSSPEYIEKAIEKSLKRMKTDRIDLYYW
jgi:aryl-alcohol dehydrogenase-like predicted oxidoreductase